MIVTCPRCLTKFNLPEDKLAPGTELNLHCSRCGSEFLFSPQYPDNDQESPEPPSPPAPEEFEATPEVETDTGADTAKDLADAAESAEASTPDVEKVAAEEAEELPDATSFEMADDFADIADLTFDEPTDSPEEDSGTTEKIKDREEEQEIEELSLNIDELDLDDIEFDSFGDEPAAADDLEEDQQERQTQLDDDGDLDDLLKQVEELPSNATASTIETETGKQTETDALGESLDASPALVKTSIFADKRRSFILVLTCFVVLSLALWIAYGLWQRFSVDMVKHLSLVEIENQRLRLPSERTVIVLRGKVVNSSNKLVTDLRIKGILLDETGQAVAEVVTAGGVSFSEEELDLLDADKLAMLENTTVTLPPNGGELPFMIAFYDYPEGARTCYVELSSFKVKKGPRP